MQHRARARARALGTIVAALAVAVVALPVLAPPPASAHAGEEALQVEPHSTWPGGTVMVRGDLPVTSDVNLLLVDSAARMTQLARVEDPPGGHFELAVTVPASTRAGEWSIVAVSAGDPVGRVALTIEAMPPAPQGRPDQAEPILAPSRPVAPAAPASSAADNSAADNSAADNSAGQPAAAAVVQAPASPAQPEPQQAGTLAVGVLVAVLLAGLTAYAILRPRRRGTRRLPGNGADQPEGTAARQRARDGVSASR